MAHGQRLALLEETAIKEEGVVVLVRLMALMVMMVVLVSGAAVVVLVALEVEWLLRLEAPQPKVAMGVTVLLMEPLLAVEAVPALVVEEITQAMVRMVKSGLLG